MAGGLGRDAILSIGASPVAAIRTKATTWSGESVDITTSDSDGYRNLLAGSGQQQIDIPFDGIIDDPTFRDIVFGKQSVYFEDLELEFAVTTQTNTTKAKLSGAFRLSGYEEGMPYNDAITFSGTLESAGEWEYTPEAV